jgi:transposase InsO family protein
LAKWTYFYLYVILDVFSRYVVGWMIATEESAGFAHRDHAFREIVIGRSGSS